MLIHIKAFREDNTEILGNLDGQAVFKCRQYKRTNHYRFINGDKRAQYGYTWPRVHHWEVHQCLGGKYSKNTKCLEVVLNN